VSGEWLPDCSVRTNEPSTILGDLSFGGAGNPIYPIALDRLSIDGNLYTQVDGRITASQLRVDGVAKFNCCAPELSITRSRFSGREFHAATSGELTLHRLANNVFSSLTFYWFDNSVGESVVHFQNNTVLTGHFSIWVYRNTTSLKFKRNLITPPTVTRFCTTAGAKDALLDASDNWLGFTTFDITLGCPKLEGNGNVIELFPSPYMSDTPPYDLHLRPGSPMIDYSPPIDEDIADTDFDGNPRLFDGSVDVGAYEAQGIFRSGFE
jgi:hypothetical protein